MKAGMKAHIQVNVASLPTAKIYLKYEKSNSNVTMNEIFAGGGIYRGLCRKKTSLGRWVDSLFYWILADRAKLKEKEKL